MSGDRGNGQMAILMSGAIAPQGAKDEDA